MKLIICMLLGLCSPAWAYPHCRLPEVGSEVTKVMRPTAFTMVYTMSSKCMACYDHLRELQLLQQELFYTKDILIDLVVSTDRPVSLKGIKTESNKKLWRELGANSGHILLFDSCQRLTYEVVVPWSLLVSHFVKGAVMSTYFGRPCGNCPLSQLIFLVSQLKNAEDDRTVGENSAENLRARHLGDHRENPYEWKYNGNGDLGSEENPFGEPVWESVSIESEEVSNEQTTTGVLQPQQVPISQEEGPTRADILHRMSQHIFEDSVEEENVLEDNEHIDVLEHYLKLSDWIRLSKLPDK